MAKKTAQSKKVVGKKADSMLLKNPRITEKTAYASAESVYVFDVAPRATKTEIAKAFEMLYKHSPVTVRTLIKKPKSHFKRTAQGSQLGFGKKIKVAYISLPKGVTIELS